MKNILRSNSQPSLGVTLKLFRESHRMKLSELAKRLGASVERTKTIENDVDLPTSEELLTLCDVLDQPPYQVLRAVKATARQLLEDAVRPAESLPERALAARQFDAKPSPGDVGARNPLPRPLQQALARTLQVSIADEPAFQQAWQVFLRESPQRQSVAIEAAVADLTLEGAPTDDV